MIIVYWTSNPFCNFDIVCVEAGHFLNSVTYAYFTTHMFVCSLTTCFLAFSFSRESVAISPASSIHKPLTPLRSCIVEKAWNVGLTGTRHRIKLTNVYIWKKSTKMTLHNSITCKQYYGSTNFDHMLPGNLQLYGICSHFHHILHRQTFHTFQMQNCRNISGSKPDMHQIQAGVCKCLCL